MMSERSEAIATLVSGTNVMNPNRVCRDCGGTLGLLWKSPGEVRKHSLDVINKWDEMELEATDIPVNGTFSLTREGWLYWSLDSDEAEAEEHIRKYKLRVSRRTICFMSLVDALIQHARAWACHGGIDINWAPVLSESCEALDPVFLQREWDRVWKRDNEDGQGGYQTVTGEQMRTLLHNLDGVVFRVGDTTREILMDIPSGQTSWRERLEAEREFDLQEERWCSCSSNIGDSESEEV